MHFTFEYPAALLLLLLLPCFYFCRKKAKSRFLPKLSWLPVRGSLLHRELWWRIAVFSLGVVALAAPIRFTAQAPTSRKGVAIVLALDTSGSMRESGFGKGEESKFLLLQRLVGNFIDQRAGDNIGVVAFGTFAFTASPVSYDLEGVKSLLEMLEVEMAGKNTAIGDAIVQSLRTLEKSRAKEKVIILVTDGKNNSGRVSPKQAVEMAKKAGVKIFTIGLGTPKTTMRRCFSGLRRRAEERCSVHGRRRICKKSTGRSTNSCLHRFARHTTCIKEHSSSIRCCWRWRCCFGTFTVAGVCFHETALS